MRPRAQTPNCFREREEAERETEFEPAGATASDWSSLALTRHHRYGLLAQTEER